MLDLLLAHLRGVVLPLEDDVSPDPVRVSLLSPDREVAHSGDGADAVEELRLVHGGRGVGRKVLKALAGAGMIHAPEATVTKSFGLSCPIA